MLSYAMYDVDLIVAGTHTSSLDDLEEEYPHSKFREYAAEVERRVEKRWKSLDYFIDERNTLSLVTGDGHLEEVSLNVIVYVNAAIYRTSMHFLWYISYCDACYPFLTREKLEF